MNTFCGDNEVINVTQGLYLHVSWVEFKIKVDSMTLQYYVTLVVFDIYIFFVSLKLCF